MLVMGELRDKLSESLERVQTYADEPKKNCTDPLTRRTVRDPSSTKHGVYTTVFRSINWHTVLSYGGGLCRTYMTVMEISPLRSRPCLSMDTRSDSQTSWPRNYYGKKWEITRRVSLFTALDSDDGQGICTQTISEVLEETLGEVRNWTRNCTVNVNSGKTSLTFFTTR